MNLSTTDKQIHACAKCFSILKQFDIVKDALNSITKLIETSKGPISKSRLIEIKKISKLSSTVISVLSNKYFLQFNQLSKTGFITDCLKRIDASKRSVTSSLVDNDSKKLKRVHDTLTKNPSQCFDLDCSDESTKSTSINQRRTITAIETVKHPSYSIPSNRRVYTPVEFVTLYNSLEWGKMILLEEWCKKGYVPVKKRQALYILAKFKTNGKIKPQWDLAGRERLLSHPDTFDNYSKMMLQHVFQRNKSSMY